MRFVSVLAGAAMLAFGHAFPAAHAADQELKTAIFAGGCFWCVEFDFDKVPGVVETISGYTGGDVANPTYEQVGTKETGHREAVQVTFDPDRVSYEELLTVFWHSIDPTDPGGQFCDRGQPYHSAVFVQSPEQRTVAEVSKEEVTAELARAVATAIEDAGPFYAAEDYHQNYYEKNWLSYKFYRWSCGRNDRVREIWGERAYTGIPEGG